MKKIGYNLVKLWIKCALHLYFGRIRISGSEHIPTDKPVLFLPNHQSALLDVLLIAVQCHRKPYFLTRADVFKNRFLASVFGFFQMIPIYRIRDGREALKNNQAVFDHCSALLEQNHALLMFPEANHNLQRRVRPLSKGFTRIIFNTLDKSPNLDIRLVPVGINYRNAIRFPDRVALYYGRDIEVGKLYEPHDRPKSTDRIKNKVAEALKTLTTHIEDETRYDSIVRFLDSKKIDYLKPAEVNAAIANKPDHNRASRSRPPKPLPVMVFEGIFTLLNLPVVLLWKFVLKPRVWEPEFIGTMRFSLALLAMPLYYSLLFVSMALMMHPGIALLAVVVLFIFNWAYVKLV